MSSTDDSPDETDDASKSFDESFGEPVKRRSTFTPLVDASPAAEEAALGLHDDDELASALAADFSRATGTIPVIYSLDDVPTQPQSEPEPLYFPAPASPAPEPAGTVDSQPSDPQVPESDDADIPPAYASAPPPAAAVQQPAYEQAPPPVFEWSEEAAAAEPAAEEPTAEGPAAEESTAVESAADAAPDTEAAPVALSAEEQASALAQQPSPLGRPWVPERRSLPDSELLEVLESANRPGGTLGAMEQLEEQLRLREEEAREFTDWESSMLSVGTPEAIESVQQVRQQFSGLIAERSPIDANQPSAVAEPTPAAGPVADSEPAPDPEPGGVADFWSAPFANFAPPSEHIPSEPEHALSEPEPSEPEPEPEAFVPPALIEPPPPYPAAESAEPWLFAPPPVVSAADADIESELTAEPELAAEQDPDAEPESAADPSPTDETPIIASVVGETGEVEQPLLWPTIPPADGNQSDTPVAALNFDDLLSGDPVHELVEPQPFTDTDTGGIVTGSVSIVGQELETEFEDDVDDTDRAFGELSGDAVPEHPVTAPVEPMLTPRIAEDALVIDPDEPRAAPVFSIEQAGLAPTAIDVRVGRSVRLFWLWFAPNASIISVAFGATLFGLGMSLRQAIVAALAGVALSFIPLGLGTLAGKRSGQPTMVVSRAAFGVVGNIAPAVLAVITRLFWGAVLLWLLAAGMASILVGAQVTAGLSYEQLVIIGLAAGFIIALLVAFFGYELLARVQLVISIIAAVLLIGLIALTWPRVDFSEALSTPDGSWMLVLTGAVLVFSFVGLVWANSSSDLARYQRPGTSGGGSMLWATFGSTLPTFLLIAYGSVLAASNPAIATGLVDDPLRTLATMLPSWYPIPLIAATVLSLLSGVVVSLYSAGFAFQSVGVRLPRAWATLAAGLVLFALAWVLSILVVDFSVLFRDVATTLAVPVAAWAGIFAADTMIRNRRYHTASLLAKGGVYPTVHWVNLPAFLVITVIGFALTSATVEWLSWQGYGFALLAVPLDGAVAGSDLGVVVALVLGLLTPIVTGIPGIRRQEAADVDDVAAAEH